MLDEKAFDVYNKLLGRVTDPDPTGSVVIWPDPKICRKSLAINLNKIYFD